MKVLKDRIVFFIIGVVLATIAYFVGGMDKVNDQESQFIINKNVVIKGGLTVKGGKILVLNEPVSENKPLEKLNFVGITASDEGAYMLLQKGPKLRGEAPATIMFGATQVDGESVSHIHLYGNYEKDLVTISSKKGLSKIQ